ncbi:TIGR01212 family radical SAM protein [Ferrigenium sp. UT5]|uniref:TIGR01212 family radical SAM protein n=1 Tax=Ferrigenium sp. UT5 TaxID=3242105 RepID=UPI0035547260
MILSRRVNTYGQDLLRRYGERIHKIALDVGMTCPNRDGSKGSGGCTFCNNDSFSPNGHTPPTLHEQLASGRRAISRGTGATKFIAYFQAYTNTYAGIGRLRALYGETLAEPDVVGLAIGTRPDCVPAAVLDLLVEFRADGLEVVLELGLQSAFDETLRRVNRGHGLAEYEATTRAARQRGIPVCAHLIVGLPGEDESHYHTTLDTVLDIGVDGLKLHPLHVVKHTMLAHEWRKGEYRPLAREDYIRIAADLIERTPAQVVYHRVTGTAPKDILLAPDWAAQKWGVLNGIERELRQRNSHQGQRAGNPCGLRPEHRRL